MSPSSQPKVSPRCTARTATGEIKALARPTFRPTRVASSTSADEFSTHPTLLSTDRCEENASAHEVAQVSVIAG